MPYSAVVGSKLVGVNSLDSMSADIRATVDEVKRDPTTPIDLKLDDITFTRSDLTRALAAVDIPDPALPEGNQVAYQAIGLGKPLTVLLQTVYVGNYPDTLRWVPGENLGDVLVTSAHKPFQNFEAAPRAVHALVSHAERRIHLEQSAAEQGSRLLYYTPAVTDASILFTVEISVDREFSTELAESLAKALSTAGALPVFATAAPFLVAGGVAVPIATRAANLLASPKPYYAETVHVNFGLAGIEAAQARALVLFPGDQDGFAGFELGKDNLLRDADGKVYGGDLPYAVVSLDGTPHTELEGWTAHAASAVLLERFFSPDERLSKALELTTEALTYFNDVKYRDRAAAAMRSAASAKDPTEKAQLEKLAQAYLKNIQNEDLRKTVEMATND